MKMLPSMEFKFELNLKGKSTGEVFKGSFTYKRLSIGDIGRASVMKTRLNGDLANVDPDIDKLHDMLSWLFYGLIEYPDWWTDTENGLKLHDMNIVEELYRRVSKFEKEWANEVKKLAEPTTENSNTPAQ